jgi:hypothetical protein
MTMRAATTTIVWLLAVLMGLGCTLLISLIMLLFRFDPAGADRPGGPTILLGLLLGWVLATWLLIRRAEGASDVLQRGFLLGAISWIVIGIMIHRLEQQIPAHPDAALVPDKASWEPTAAMTLRGPGGAVVARSGAFALAGACLVAWGLVFIAARMHARSVARRRPPATVGAPGNP